MKTLLLTLLCGFAASSLFAQNLSFSVDLQNSHALEQRTFGFNSAYTPSYVVDSCNAYSWYFSGPCAAAPDLCLRDDVTDPLANLEPLLLRFPGGTIANYYHLGELDQDGCGTDNTGYGVILNEVSFLLGNTIGQQLNRDQEVDRNHIFNFIDMVKALETELNRPVEVIYVLNLLSHFKGAGRGDALDSNLTRYQNIMAENLAGIQLFKDHGVEVNAVECGNELYFPHYTGPLTHDVDVEEYLALSQHYNAKLKATFPGVKTGLAVELKPNNSWTQEFVGDTAFDAFIIHEYYRQANDGTVEDFVYDGFFDELADFNSTLGSDKEIWLTEWNIEQSEPNIKTFEHSAFVLETLLGMQEFNATHPTTITYANYHNLLTLNGPSVVFASQFDTIVTQPVHNGFELASFAFNGHGPASPVAAEVDLLTGLSTTNLSDSCHLRAFLVRPQQQGANWLLSVFYANRSANSLQLDLAASAVMDGGQSVGIDAAGLAHSYYTATSLYAVAANISPRQSDNSSLIAPYSIGRFDLPLSVVTAVPEVEDLDAFRIGPNPSEGRIFIDCKDANWVGREFELVNLLGETVSRGRLERGRNWVETNEKGLLLLRVEGSGRSFKLVLR